MKGQLCFIRQDDNVTKITKVIRITYEYCQSLFTVSPPVVELKTPFLPILGKTDEKFQCVVRNISHVIDSLLIGPVPDYIRIDEMSERSKITVTKLKDDNSMYSVEIFPLQEAKITFHLLYDPELEVFKKNKEKDNQLQQHEDMNINSSTNSSNSSSNEDMNNDLTIPIKNIYNPRNSNIISVTYNIYDNILQYPNQIILPPCCVDNRDPNEEIISLYNIYNDKLTISFIVEMEEERKDIDIILLSRSTKNVLQSVSLSPKDKYEIVIFSVPSNNFNFPNNQSLIEFEGNLLLQCHSSSFELITLKIPFKGQIKDTPKYSISSTDNLIFVLTPSTTSSAIHLDKSSSLSLSAPLHSNSSFYYISNNDLTFTIENHSSTDSITLQMSSKSYYYPEMIFKLDNDTRDSESDSIYTDTIYPMVTPELETIEPLQKQVFHVRIIDGKKTYFDGNNNGLLLSSNTESNENSVSNNNNHLEKVIFDKDTKSSDDVYNILYISFFYYLNS